MTLNSISEAETVTGLIFVKKDRCYWFRNFISESWIALPEYLNDRIISNIPLPDVVTLLKTEGYCHTAYRMALQLGLDNSAVA